MISLSATTKALELVTSAAASVDYDVSWAEEDRSGATPDVIQDSNEGNVNTATTTVIVAAPAANKKRLIRHISLLNAHATVSVTVTVQKDISTTNRGKFVALLQPGWQAHYSDRGWLVLDNLGRAVRTPVERQGYTGGPMNTYKVGTAAEAVGRHYCHSKDSGFPGAWAPGTPGLNGRATDGTAAGDAGCIPFQNPATGNLFLTQWRVTSSTPHHHYLFDVLWVNSGIAVTTTTAQGITSVAWPARDAAGSTNGLGVMVGILVTTATTNAGAITNTTLNYTNQAGTAGRTATIASFPATAVVGTVVWFQLQAGDSGVRSIQGITLGTSYGGGAISLIAVRMLMSAAVPAANIGSMGPDLEPGVRLYNGSCMLHGYVASATTATNTATFLTMMER